MATPGARAAAAADPPRKRTNLIQFFREVRTEARKTTWTSWRETWITSMMVFGMVTITAVFFLIIDLVLGQGLQFLLKMAS